MGDSFKEMVYLSVTLVIFSVLLWVIVFVSSAGFSLLSIGKEKESLKTELAIQRELASYDNKLLTRDDVQLSVLKFARQYDMIIQRNMSSNDTNYGIRVDGNDIFLDRNALPSEWDLSLITPKIERDIENYAPSDSVVYKSVLIRDINTGVVTTIAYTLQ